MEKTSHKSVSRKRIPYGLIIFVVAYTLRLAYIIEISDRPYFSAPAVDPAFHDIWALEIAEGKLVKPEPFFRAPLYPYFLGGIYALFGHDYFIPRVIQALIDSFTCVLIYLLGRKLFSERVGILAGFIAAGAWMMIYFQAELLIPVIILPLDLGLILLLIKSVEKDRGIHWWIAGLLFGLSLIARPNVAIILPLVIYLFFRKSFFKRSLTRAGYFTLGLIIPLLPVTYHNLRTGDFTLIATQGGVNFYIGNNPKSVGSASDFPGLGNIWRYEDTIDLANAETGRELKPSEVSGFYYHKGLNYILNRPGQWLGLMGRKTILLLNGIEISNNKNIYFAARDSLMLTSGKILGFWLYGPLGLLGFILFYRRGWRERMIIWFSMLYSFSIILFFVTARYRMPLAPFLIIFAAAALVHIIDQIRSKDYRKLVVPAIAFLGLNALVNVNWLGQQKIAWDYAHFSLGNAYQKKGELVLAEKEYQKALEYNPRYLQVHLNLGVIYYERGDYEKAEKEFWEELKYNHGFEAAYVYNNLGNIRYQEGSLEEAMAMYKLALEIYPAYEDGKYNLAKTYNDLGMLKVRQDSLELAKEYLKKVIEFSPAEPTHYFNYGLVLGELGFETEAEEQLHKALKIDPHFQPAIKALEAVDRKRQIESNK